MVRVRIALLALAAAVALVAGGCGNSKEKVTAAELKVRADGICRREQANFDRIQAHPPANASIAADQTNELVDVSEAASSDLGNLEPPEPLGDAYDRYLEARDRAIDEMKKGKDAADDADSAAYSAAQNAVAAGAPERQHLAGALGLRVCGANPRTP
jgi:hypothetical protein